MPAYQIYGESFNPGDFLYFLSARASMISCLYLNNYFGQEFTLSRISKFENDNDNIYGAMNGYTFGYNLLFINWMAGREAAVSFRIGIGFSMQPMDLSYSNIGISFLYRIFQKLYIEAGVDFPYSLYENESGYLMPWIGLSMVF